MVSPLGDIYHGFILSLWEHADRVKPLSEADREWAPLGETSVFETNSQALNHMLLNPALTRCVVPGTFDIVHVNAEYADQVSDHDPLVARFGLVAP
jgi:predicted extracellular nuclease